MVDQGAREVREEIARIITSLVKMIMQYRVDLAIGHIQAQSRFHNSLAGLINPTSPETIVYLMGQKVGIERYMRLFSEERENPRPFGVLRRHVEYWQSLFNGQHQREVRAALDKMLLLMQLRKHIEDMLSRQPQRTPECGDCHDCDPTPNTEDGHSQDEGYGSVD